MYIVEGVQAPFDLLRVLFVLWVGRVRLLGCCCLNVIPTKSWLELRERKLTPFTGFGGSRSASVRLGISFLHRSGLRRHCLCLKRGESH